MRYSLAGLVTITLALFPFASGASSPDLCGDVHRGPTGAPIVDSTGFEISKFCEATNELDVAPWGDDVCCTFSTGSPSVASCTATDSAGRCLTGFKFACDFATVSGSSVTCQQAWPDACAEGFCTEVLPGGATPSPEDTLCCEAEDDCYEVDPGDPSGCWGKWVSCSAPYQNADGSIGCSDDE